MYFGEKVQIISQGIKFKLLAAYPGYDEYMAGLVGLAVPTVGADYWSTLTKDKWSYALRGRLLKERAVE